MSKQPLMLPGVLPATRDELETQLMQAVNSLDAGRGVNGEAVFRRLRKRIKEARG